MKSIYIALVLLFIIVIVIKGLSDITFSELFINDANNLENNQKNENKEKKQPFRMFNLHLPDAKKYETDKLQLYILDNFLTKEECEKLITLIKSDLFPSTTTTGESNYRTSYSSNLTNTNHSEFIDSINKKICKKMNIPSEYSRNMQGQHYSVGQEFKIHTDWFDPEKDTTQIGTQGNRTWTFMIYLNDVEEGGETYFRDINHKFKPIQGRAIIWNNLLENGDMNYNTNHAGLPIKKGEKVIITKWFREYSTVE